jgi:Uma2 family endonuclease
MIQKTLVPQSNPLAVKLPPTQAELPADDDIPMETQRHRLQMELLVNPLSRWLVSQGRNAFVGGNMFVYFSPDQVRRQDYRGPDVFAVLDVPVGERLSWVVWEEGKAPDVVIELLSETTAAKDKGEKKLIYQHQLRVPEYYWYDPLNPEDFAGFRLLGGNYEPLLPDEEGRLISQGLGLALVRWQGIYGNEREPITWLRWSTLEGVLLPTGEERAEQAEQRAEQAEQRAEQAERRVEQEKARADCLAARLKAMGIDLEAE